ncbi:MAG: FAD:protein FMN transferase [Paraprevotella sp.]|nr:FAD:protein FMN transferase [Paraprevotella sp.]
MNFFSKKTARWGFLLLLIAGTVYAIRTNRNIPFQRNEGMIFGTTYHITYQWDSDLHADIRNEMEKVNASLSPFNPRSIISAVNRNEDVLPDSMFTEVFELAGRISENTDGAFDITIAPLVNAWGFGFENNDRITPNQIDSLLAFVGHRKVSMENGRIVKRDPRTILDCSAIAKGYGCDVVARMLDRRGVRNYMVEIGGEIVLHGQNPRRKAWQIGINQPVEDSLNISGKLETILNATDIAMATSGNYRNFYYKDGRKFAHTIDPHTGYPVQHSLLSSTVLAPECAVADAYATAFMVMGLDSAKQIAERHPELMVYFIYADEQGNNRSYYSPELKKMIQKN